MPRANDPQVGQAGAFGQGDLPNALPTLSRCFRRHFVASFLRSVVPRDAGLTPKTVLVPAWGDAGISSIALRSYRGFFGAATREEPMAPAEWFGHEFVLRLGCFLTHIYYPERSPNFLPMKTSWSAQRSEELNREGRGSSVGKALFAVLPAVCALLILNGCTTFEIDTKTRTLSENGFVARVPETPQQREAYAALTPYKLYRGVVRGSVFYVYKDEKNGVAYIGTDAEYQRYLERARRLVAAFETTEEKMAAYDMDSDLAYRWYGSWGNFGAAHPRE